MAGSRRNKKVVSIKKYRRSGNTVSVILFGMLFLYIFTYAYRYFSKERISIYEVTVQGTITKEEQYTGVILRDETVYRTDVAGYVNFYLREGERAAVGDMIYTLDESGHISELLFAENSNALKEADLTELKKEISTYCMNYNAMDFEEIYNFKVDLDYSVLELAGQNNIANLDQILKESGTGFFKKHTAEATGTVAYYTDGMELLTREQISAETFVVENYKKESVKSADLLENGGAVYKLVKSNDWSLIFPIDEEFLSRYGDKTRLEIHFVKDDFQTVADFEMFTNASGVYGVLNFDRYMLRYLSDRYLTFEIVEEVETGLKIPVTAVTEKSFYTVPLDYLAKADTGNVFYLETYDANGAAITKNVEARIYQKTDNFYYVDMGSFNPGDTLVKPDSNEHYKIGITSPLKGVYSVNQGYTIFRQIEIISENEEYYIIKTGTPYGISLYDHIILNSKTVEEKQIIYE
ncbi:MAG: hypothetical protein J6J86_02020 [Lachnospiraceae bacterium]|nr:hypothetical protein [Lachnospiraceae bacterium]